MHNTWCRRLFHLEWQKIRPGARQEFEGENVIRGSYEVRNPGMAVTERPGAIAFSLKNREPGSNT